MQYVVITGDSGRLIRNSAALFHGYNISANSGDTIVEFYDGVDDSGVLVFEFHIKNGSHADMVVESGVPFNNGIYYKLVSGSATGSVFAS